MVVIGEQKHIVRKVILTTSETLSFIAVVDLAALVAGYERNIGGGFGVAPQYEYLCSNCQIIEVWQGIRERPIETCPNCDSPIERLISLPSGFVLEPKGHYIPAPGFDKKGRMNEVKISPGESERGDRLRRQTMLDTRARAIKQGQTLHFDERKKGSPRKYF